MRLKQECIRDVLLGLEEELKFNQVMERTEFLSIGRLSNHSAEDSLYTVMKLHEAGFLHVQAYLGGNFRIFGITYEGHQFLENVRDPEIWAKTKAAASKVGGASLSVVGELALSFVRQSLGLS
ncbi:DUF2513 domain-containing protein [Bacillus safensis]|uniref:DUF2513 domain-containing protein n=1 Tax=Bacillus safensis TaxID=561879 RepID=UPI001CF03D16|nr:DUF2513 domain-containing protein [Bacillus safensis]MCA6607467.1 DUF2513 domain-containing protein [Bacillus safensis]